MLIERRSNGAFEQVARHDAAPVADGEGAGVT
jgi:hypothetical protein